MPRQEGIHIAMGGKLFGPFPFGSGSMPLQVRASGQGTEVLLGGQPAVSLQAGSKGVVLGFALQGAGSELHLQNLKLEPKP
jgi:hypothetical protein